MQRAPERFPRRPLGISGILVGLSLLLIGAGNYFVLFAESSGFSLEDSATPLIVSAILAIIGLSLISLSFRFVLSKSVSSRLIMLGFLLYASILTILSLVRNFQLDSDTILNAEVAIMIALVGASTRLRGRFRALMAGLPLIYIGILFALVEGYSTSQILSFHTNVSPPELGLLFSWRPFEVASIFLAGFASLAGFLKRRVAPLAFFSLLAYSLGVLIPLLLPATNVYALLQEVIGGLSPPLPFLPKLAGVILLLLGNIAAAITAVVGIASNRRSPRSATASQGVKLPAVPSGDRRPSAQLGTSRNLDPTFAPMTPDKITLFESTAWKESFSVRRRP